MDNEAFRALVQERAMPKSTKEIAREAVEEEFRTRKKKRKRGGGSSSEEEGSDNDDSDREEPHKDLLIPTAAKKKIRKDESKYRDRAKERREGKNVDYEAQATLLEGVAASAAEGGGEMDQVTMSKYLGGDEAHTHLVKGLDVALARRVKRQMDKETTRTSEKNTVSLPKAQAKKSKSIVLVRDSEEARALLQRTKAESISSELGRQMLHHMKSTYLPSQRPCEISVPKSPAGFAIQRSSLTFAIAGDPRDRKRAWEVPMESMHASSKTDRDVSGTTRANGAISLDTTLLHRIQHAFAENADKKRQLKSGESKKEEEGDDDEDDIFGDIEDYAPPTRTETKIAGEERKESQSKATSGSIFAGLAAPKQLQPPPSAKPSPSVSVPTEQEKKRKVISRDVLGSMPQGPSKKAQQGVSISAYDGGYGEEMDVDFDGRFAAEDEDNEDGGGGKKKQRDKTTSK